MKREKLVEIRERNKLNQREMSELINVSKSMYSRIEGGERDPSLKLSIKIADILGIKSLMEFKEIFGTSTGIEGKHKRA